MRPLLAALALIAAPALAEDDHVAERDGLRAVHAWTRATAAETALVFVEIENRGAAPVTLSGGATGIAERVVLVGLRLEDGTPVLEEIDAIPVPAGRELMLDPDGLALRLDGLSAALAEGDQFDLELATSLGPLEVHVEVEAADARAHSHAGHNH